MTDASLQHMALVASTVSPILTLLAIVAALYLGYHQAKQTKELHHAALLRDLLNAANKAATEARQLRTRNQEPNRQTAQGSGRYQVPAQQLKQNRETRLTEIENHATQVLLNDPSTITFKKVQILIPTIEAHIIQMRAIGEAINQTEIK